MRCCTYEGIGEKDCRLETDPNDRDGVSFTIMAFPLCFGGSFLVHIAVAVHQFGINIGLDNSVVVRIEVFIIVVVVFIVVMVVGVVVILVTFLFLPFKIFSLFSAYLHRDAATK